MLTCCDLCKSTRGYLARTGQCATCGRRPSDRALAARGSAWSVDRATGRHAIVAVRDASFSGEFGDETAAQQASDDALDKDFTAGDYAVIALAGVAAPAGLLYLLGVKGWWWLTMLPLSYVGIGVASVAVIIGKSKSGDKVAQQWELAHGVPAGQLGTPAAT